MAKKVSPWSKLRREYIFSEKCFMVTRTANEILRFSESCTCIGESEANKLWRWEGLVEHVTDYGLYVAVLPSLNMYPLQFIDRKEMEANSGEARIMRQQMKHILGRYLNKSSVPRDLYFVILKYVS